jgi:hypothetical protein
MRKLPEAVIRDQKLIGSRLVDIPQHTRDQLDLLKVSIAKFGQARPVLCRAANRMIIAGHAVHLAMTELGRTEIDCLRSFRGLGIISEIGSVARFGAIATGFDPRKRGRRLGHHRPGLTIEASSRCTRPTLGRSQSISINVSIMLRWIWTPRPRPLSGQCLALLLAVVRRQARPDTPSSPGMR